MDSHAHLSFYQNEEREKILDRAWSSGLEAILTVSTQPQDWATNCEIASRNSAKIFWTIGLHPTEISKFRRQLDVDGESLRERLLEQLDRFFDLGVPPVAVGEIGLDYHQQQVDRDEQKVVFREQLLWAQRRQLPVVIHCRDAQNEREAWTDCLQLLSDVNFDGENVLMHCFSYGPTELRAWNQIGARASFTALLTYPNADYIRGAFLDQPLEKTMFETDCPFLLPESKKGDRRLKNEPAFIWETMRLAAELTSRPLKEIAQLSLNAGKQFFRLGEKK